MCIIVYKPKGVDLPKKSVLKTCFSNNTDGCGYMYHEDGTDKVIINKGFFKFEEFYKMLKKDIKNIKDAEVVLHFRITTQGGVRADCCHPYPLSNKMQELRKLKSTASVGVAHNGVISLTSTYGARVDYNDTMQFIKEYLTLIIDKKSLYTYYKDLNKITLINRLIGSSRLAILDSKGHCELIGDGWVQDGGCYYSNTSYKTYKIKLAKTTTLTPYKWDFTNDDEWWYWYNDKTSMFEFDEEYCPYSVDGDGSYCTDCARCKKCWEVLEDDANDI